jgi:uncharacterized membrane protein
MEKATFGLDENIAAAACYVLGWLTGIIFFIMEKENKTVRFHAMQSILTFLPLCVVYWVLSLVFFMIGLGFIGLLVALVMLVLWLVLMLKAYQGEKFKLPVVGDIAESQA